eukprot:scaffold4298_cov55-Cylindrotheca_fusiformis.AAC.1
MAEHPNIMDETARKRKSSEMIEEQGRDASKFFVYTSETKDENIPKETLTHLQVDSSVTEIPDKAFRNCGALEHVKLPESLTRIGKFAFERCIRLKLVQFASNNDSCVALSNHPDFDEGTIVFPETLLQIDNNAFRYCHSLRKVMFCSVSTKRGEGVFRFCRGLLSVELPEGLQVIEKWLFSDCESLTTVKIPSSVVKVAEFAFFRCSLLPSVDLPQGLLEIGVLSFAECCSIETLLIPATVSSIGESAFLGCTGLTYITLPPTLETIEARMLNRCGRLEYIDIPSTVSFIGVRAFYNCDSLSHIRIPPSVVKIAPNAFLGCRSLISVELPEGILIGIDDDDGVRGIPDGERFFVFVNLAMPKLPEDDEVVSGFLYNDSRLGSVFDDEADLVHALKHRFANSPLNKLCYYQSYHASEDAMVHLRLLMDDDPLAATNQTDEFGMTPLHVLSLAQTPNIDMLLAVMNAGKADHLVLSRDSFGFTPLDYLCLNRMPNSIEVIRR